MSELRGDLKFNEPMAAHTSWRAGGPADRCYRPADLQDLRQFLDTLPPDEPLYWVGLGSNLLVRDGGIRGVVIATHKALDRIELRGERIVYVEAGVPGAKLARFAIRSGLTGAEFFAGIPGTFGGALAMNAGAFGGETWDVVSSAETVDRHGVVRRRRRPEFAVAYREVRTPPGEWFLAGELTLQPGDTETSRERVKSLLSRRAQTQPIQLPNAGSVFRNPPGDFAARLIEASGLKGTCMGLACVSDRHANFIVNRGGATAADIEALIEHLRDAVQRQQGVRLQAEVHVVGVAR